MNHSNRRSFITLTLAAAAGSSWAQPGFPNKPMRIIVAFPPGGSTTVVARLLGQKLSERLGQTVVIDNKPGGNGVIASEELLRSAPDGHHMVMVVNTHTINPHMMARLPYNTERDFSPVSTLYRFDLILVAHPAVPANNLREFIALAKANPSAINFAAGDNAGLTHLAAETFNTMAGVKLQVVPYKGSGPALSDTLAGHVQAYFSSPIAVISQIKAGKLKGVAISGRSRSVALPEVPTFAEAGLPGYEAGTWAGILAHGTTPKELVNKLAAEIAAVMALPDVRENLQSQGLEPTTTSPAEFAAIIKSDMTRFEKVIQAANLKTEK
jgi:tripartite-type tricarboxylate transporter receptor subunit TctC